MLGCAHARSPGKVDTVNDEGTPTSQNVDDFVLSDDRESIYPFNVPDNLRKIQFTVAHSVMLQCACGNVLILSAVDG